MTDCIHFTSHTFARSTAGGVECLESKVVKLTIEMLHGSANDLFQNLGQPIPVALKAFIDYRLSCPYEDSTRPDGGDIFTLSHAALNLKIETITQSLLRNVLRRFAHLGSWLYIVRSQAHTHILQHDLTAKPKGAASDGLSQKSSTAHYSGNIASLSHPKSLQAVQLSSSLREGFQSTLTTLLTAIDEKLCELEAAVLDNSFIHNAFNCTAGGSSKHKSYDAGTEFFAPSPAVPVVDYSVKITLMKLYTICRAWEPLVHSVMGMIASTAHDIKLPLEGLPSIPNAANTKSQYYGGDGGDGERGESNDEHRQATREAAINATINAGSNSISGGATVSSNRVREVCEKVVFRGLLQELGALVRLGSLVSVETLTSGAALASSVGKGYGDDFRPTDHAHLTRSSSGHTTASAYDSSGSIASCGSDCAHAACMTHATDMGRDAIHMSFDLGQRADTGIPQLGRRLDRDIGTGPSSAPGFALELGQRLTGGLSTATGLHCAESFRFSRLLLSVLLQQYLTNLCSVLWASSDSSSYEQAYAADALLFAKEARKWKLAQVQQTQPPSQHIHSSSSGFKDALSRQQKKTISHTLNDMGTVPAAFERFNETNNIAARLVISETSG